MRRESAEKLQPQQEMAFVAEVAEIEGKRVQRLQPQQEMFVANALQGDRLRLVYMRCRDGIFSPQSFRSD